MKRLLLLSSSRKGNLGYLEHAGEQFRAFFQDAGVRRVLFAPYAAATFSFEEYEAKVRPAYAALGIELESMHRFANPRLALETAEALAVGGGNTFALLKRLYDAGLVEAIRERAENGMPYMGWSAGTNVACPTIRTTNDMPVVEPPSLKACALIPFQINPHFISGKPSGHNGESREERLDEFLCLNPEQKVLALREGSALLVEGENATLLGDLDAPVFRPNNVTDSISPGCRFKLDEV